MNHGFTNNNNQSFMHSSIPECRNKNVDLFFLNFNELFKALFAMYS